jgi:hypothetical protein
MELRRVRNFLGLSQVLVSVATGVSVHRISGEENGRLELNDTERRALEQFYKQKLKILDDLSRPPEPAYKPGNQGSPALALRKKSGGDE